MAELMTTLFLHNQTHHTLKVFEMSTIQRIAAVVAWPVDGLPHHKVLAGSFGVEGAWKTSLQAASLYESPDPNQVIVLWYTAMPDKNLSKAGAGHATAACAEVAVFSKDKVVSEVLGRSTKRSPKFAETQDFTATLPDGSKKDFTISVSDIVPNDDETYLRSAGDVHSITTSLMNDKGLPLRPRFNFTFKFQEKVEGNPRREPRAANRTSYAFPMQI